MSEFERLSKIGYETMVKSTFQEVENVGIDPLCAWENQSEDCREGWRSYTRTVLSAAKNPPLATAPRDFIRHINGILAGDSGGATRGKMP